MKEYVEYLEAYVREFKLENRIRLNSKVTNISRAPQGGHLVSYVRRQEDGEWEGSECDNYPSSGRAELIRLI